MVFALNVFSDGFLDNPDVLSQMDIVDIYVAFHLNVYSCAFLRNGHV